MAVTDIATRTYNHGWRLDPIVRSLLDTDFYKLLMLQMIRAFYPKSLTRRNFAPNSITPAPSGSARMN